MVLPIRILPTNIKLSQHSLLEMNTTTAYLSIVPVTKFYIFDFVVVMAKMKSY
jgi:hypothetical protein